ncbi:MAG: response regulator, partial [Candidatus Aminicenantes bacterium]
MRETYSKVKKCQRGIKRTNVLWLLLFLFIALFLGSTGGRYLSCKNPGLKYYRNYSPDEYGFQPQNWCILQDKRGVIYAANNGGVMQYDGVSWTLIPVRHQVVRSLAIDDTGTIYVGGINELGYLGPDSRGQIKYISLVQHLEERAKNFGNVWRTHTAGEVIFFRTSKYLFRWNPQKKQMNILLEAKTGEKDRIKSSFTCGGRFLVKQDKVGLLELEKDSFKIIVEAKTFDNLGPVFIMVPFDTAGKKILIGTREKGFFIFDGNTITHFPTEVDNYLKDKQIYHGIRLSQSPGDIAIGSLLGGLVVMDLRGKLKYLFTKESGLQDYAVKYLFEDSQGNLWAALDNGISKIEYSAPLSVYDDKSGLPGLVLSVTCCARGLYAGTTQGLFHLALNDSRFNPVTEVSGSCWSLLSIGDSVLAAADSGVYQVKNHTIRKITNRASFALVHSRKNPHRIWVGMANNLGSLALNPTIKKSQGDEWTEEYIFEKVNKQTRTMIEDREGNLWLGTRPSGVIKIIFPDKGNIRDYKVKTYDTSHHLPQGEVQVCWAADHVLFGTKENLLRVDEERNRFIPDMTFGKEFFQRLIDVYRVEEDRKGNIRIHSKGRNYQAVPKPGHGYEIEEKPLARIPISAQVNTIYPDPLGNNITWFASHKGLIRFDSRLKKENHGEYCTVIRKVLVNGTPQFYNKLEESDQQAVPVIAFKDRNLRFEFAAPFFQDETRITYSFILSGYENHWTDELKETFKEYTNLDAGVYTFRVKGKNVYGDFGREACFTFRIQTPWYRSWWAFLSYVLLFFLTLFLTVKWRSNKLKQEKKRLEQEVRERTKEINMKNQQLQKQTRLLIEQAEQLKELDHAKSRFFANISHEFRTPLTLIIGPLEQILSGQVPGPLRNKLNLMQQNSHRLLILINRLLDLSRIDSGKMKLRAGLQDIIPFLKGILASFEHPLQENELTLDFHNPEESIHLYFDREKLEEVFTNLLANAVKFTPAGGQITVSVRQIMEREEDFPGGSLEVLVRDTGIGIPREQLAHIFDRFFQVESHEWKHKGSGIGLALTRELVLLHHGKIDVNSQVGENSGTEFILRFPLGKDHLKPQEIIDPAKKVQETGDSQINLREEGLEEIPIETGEIEPGVKPGQEGQSGLKPTILVVEDNPGMRQFIRESIEAFYTVVEAGDGEEGRQKAQTLMPDLIISDIMMPKMDGYELCQNLKTQFKTSHIPIILLTAKAS